MKEQPVVETRKEPSERARYLVWGAAAGRCTLCNRSVLFNDDLGIPVPIAELAHNVGATSTSPRGDSPLDRDERAEAENLLLVCRTCHKPIDDGGQLGRWTVEELLEKKRAHEERILMLTDIGADQAAFLVRLVGSIRGTSPELTRDTVLDAATSAGFYPQYLPTAHYADIDLDLRSRGDQLSVEDFESCAQDINQLAERVHDGVRTEAIRRVAVFAFARIPLLVRLGASLDDKLDIRVFQRHRLDGANAWRWPNTETTASIRQTMTQRGTDPARVALVLSLSGTVLREELPTEIDVRYSIYEIKPEAPSVSGPGLVSSLGDLAQVEGAFRGFLAEVESSHGKLREVDVFLAIGVASAVTLGRVLMPNVSPALNVWDRDERGVFFRALQVAR